MTPALVILLSFLLPWAAAVLIRQHMAWKRDEADEAVRRAKVLGELEGRR